MIGCLRMVLIGWLSSLTLGISSHQKVCGIWILKEHVLFMFRTGVVLVIKQMYPKSLEIDKMRRTDCRGAHPAGESEGSFPSVLRMFVFQQELYCSHIVKLEGRAAVPGSPESSHSDWASDPRPLLSWPGDNGATFFCCTLLSVDFRCCL